MKTTHLPFFNSVQIFFTQHVSKIQANLKVSKKTKIHAKIITFWKSDLKVLSFKSRCSKLQPKKLPHLVTLCMLTFVPKMRRFHAILDDLSTRNVDNAVPKLFRDCMSCVPVEGRVDARKGREGAEFQGEKKEEIKVLGKIVWICLHHLKKLFAILCLSFRAILRLKLDLTSVWRLERPARTKVRSLLTWKISDFLEVVY